MALTLGELFASPDHYLHSFDGDGAIFVPMDRAAYYRSIFLDGRISPAGEGEMRIPLATLGRAPAPLPTSWIFHVAHCGSTLLARALDQLQTNLVLREPLALRQCAIASDRQRLALAAAMISKRYRVDMPTIVKANVPVNFILADLAALDPQAHTIFLHLGLRDYLLAILRSDNHRDWLGRVTAQLAPHLGDLTHLTDAQRAAALWAAQMGAFARALAILPNARVLDAEIFFVDPRAVLGAAAAHFGVAMDRAAVDRCVAGPLFATYSKNPDVPFDNAARIARRTKLERDLASELDQGKAWVGRFATDIASAQAALAARCLVV
jgi:hypothetical protein